MAQPLMAYVAGEFLPADRAAVPVDNLGLLQGVGAYETLRTYGGRPFRLSEHLCRLRGSLDFLGLRPAESDHQIAEIVTRLVEGNGVPDARIRITVAAGVDADPPPAILIVTAVRLKPYAAENYSRGAAVVIAAAQAKVRDPMAIHKMTSRVKLFLARREARRVGAVEAILLNTEGRVAEGAGSNVFIVRGSRVITPPPEEGLLPGIARAAVLEMAGDVVERPVTRDELLAADEVFLTNSIMEVMPVVSIDGQAVGGGRPGPVTRRLAEAYKALVAREMGAA
jgi:branched-chain amino acid aminotransferase